MTTMYLGANNLPSAVVAIPDVNFRACLSDKLGQVTTAPIRDTQLATITALNCNGRPITNMGGWH